MAMVATLPVWNWSALDYVNIVVLRGSQPHGSNSKPSPDIVADLVDMGGRVHMRSGSGDAISFPDAAFRDVVFVANRAALVADADVVVAIQPPAPEVVDHMKRGAILICSQDARHDDALIEHLLANRITCFAVADMPPEDEAIAPDGRPQSHLLALLRRGHVIALDWQDEALASAALTHAGQWLGGSSPARRPHDRHRSPAVERAA